MTRQEIEQMVNRFMIDHLELEEEKIVPNANLKADIGLTSLDIMETRIFITRKFGLHPTREDMVRLSVLSDVYDYIETNQK